jgi:hypothetical protein
MKCSWALVLSFSAALSLTTTGVAHADKLYVISLSMAPSSSRPGNYTAIVDVDTSGVTSVGNETAPLVVTSFNFPLQGSQSCSNVGGTAHFSNGELTQAQAVCGGAWGFNAGFGCSDLAAFYGIDCSSNWFGSLDAGTFMDGAGNFTIRPDVCVGDCGESGGVTVDEIITLVNIALGNARIDDCLAGDVNGDRQISVDEILAAVNNALTDCAGSTALGTAQLLLARGFGPADIAYVLRDTFELQAYDTGLVLKQLGFNEHTIQGALIDTYSTYAVIVDIKSITDNDPVPSGYTGLAFCGDPELDATVARCTEPYIPGLFGHFVSPSDINRGIGGDFRWVYVKYDLVPRTSDRPVATAIMAAHWPNWNVSCPLDWTPVSALTTRTNDACDRIGMCARYQPFNNATHFVTNAAISFGDWGNPATKCSAVCGSNGNIWPLYTDSQDIHAGCGDERWVYFCYNQAQAWPARPTAIEVADSEKPALLEQYAPRVFLHPNEEFYPSSVEWSFKHLFRYSPSNLPPFIDSPWFYHLFPQPDNRYYVSPIEIIGSPSDWLEYHYGCNGFATTQPCQLSDATTYAFWDEQAISVENETSDVINLTYFFYYPYNRGKEIASTVWGNHVGDWEHITVRLSWVYDPSAGWGIKPIHLFVSAHDFGTAHPWDTITTAAGSDHPIVYSAEGGHGNYVTAGTQRYGKVVKLGVTLAFLYDYTGEGAQWNTWTNLDTFDYNAAQGLGLSIWPRWMSTDYAAACAPDNPGCDPYDPASGAIYRWGTYEFGDCDIGYCRMDSGPTGPVAKGIWDNPYEP